MNVLNLSCLSNRTWSYHGRPLYSGSFRVREGKWVGFTVGTIPGVGVVDTPPVPNLDPRGEGW